MKLAKVVIAIQRALANMLIAKDADRPTPMCPHSVARFSCDAGLLDLCCVLVLKPLYFALQ